MVEFRVILSTYYTCSKKNYSNPQLSAFQARYPNVRKLETIGRIEYIIRQAKNVSVHFGCRRHKIMCLEVAKSSALERPS